MSADAACRGATAVTVGGKPGGTLTSLFGAFCALCERADDAIPAAKRFPAAKCVRCQPNYGFDATGKVGAGEGGRGLGILQRCVRGAAAALRAWGARDTRPPGRHATACNRCAHTTPPCPP